MAATLPAAAHTFGRMTSNIDDRYRVDAEQTQRMLMQRLTATEEQLAMLQHDTLASQLADTKMSLAQSEFSVLHLQVRPYDAWESNVAFPDERKNIST